jgi:beta-lactamase regulating signal transducer with metallopeptidase domain
MSELQIFSEWSNWAWRLTLNHLWQATLVFLIALLASVLLRRGPARARYVVWLAVSVKFAIPSAVIILAMSGMGIKVESIFDSSPASTPTLQYITPMVSPVVMPESYLTAIKPTPSLKSSTEELAAAQAVNRVGLIVCIVWLLGAASFFYAWLKRRRRVSETIEKGRLMRAGREWEALTKVTSWLGITRRIDLIMTPEVTEPGVWRVFRPIVLLPEAISSQLNDEELETLMMHEMAHVLRWDNLVSNLNMVLCCIFWFNPIVWLIDTWLLKEREEACDEVVLRWSGAGEVYASSIKKIYRFCLTSRVSGLSAAGGSKLKHRLEHIVANRTGERFSPVHKLLVVIVIVGSVVLSVVAAMPPGERVVAQTNTVLQQAANGLVQQITPAEGKECTEPDLKKCLPPTRTAIEAQSDLGHVEVVSDANALVQAGTEAVTQIHRKLANLVSDPTAARPAPEQAPVFQSAHAVDLKKFVGRYGIDPGVMENFVLDVTAENGDLWFKPSHASKRRLIAQSAVDYLDSESSETRITFNFDSTGHVGSLTLRGWGPTIVANRLVLPPPSREGNITFKLNNLPGARIVAVAGTFNNWNQSQYLFERTGNEWICRINLPPGKYQYKFIVDGNWLVDPNNPIVVEDERGLENSQLIVR